MSVSVFLDGEDFTRLVLEGSVTHQHNRPSFASVRMVSLYAPSTDPLRCKITLAGGIDFHGMIVSSEDEGDENESMTTFTFADPTLLFEYRICRDGAASNDAGDFSNPTFIYRNMNGPAMLREVIEQSILDTDPADNEGPMGIQLGTFASGGINLRGAPTDWPIRISDLIALLVDTGEVDVVNEPIDPGNGDMGRIHVFNGNFGTDHSGTVSFEYAVGGHTAKACARVRDYKDLMNKLWIYLGPRKLTAADPAGDQHWAANITGTQQDLGPDAGTVRTKVLASRETYYTRMAIRIFDAQGDERPDLFREVYKRWFLMESWMRAAPSTHVHITPNAGIEPSFRTGDLIHVAAGTKFRGGFSGRQRVMEYTYRWDTQGNVELGAPIGQATVPAVVTTADSEGMRPRAPEDYRNIV